MEKTNKASGNRSGNVRAASARGPASSTEELRATRAGMMDARRPGARRAVRSPVPRSRNTDMSRGSFLRTAGLGAAGVIGASGFTGATSLQASSSKSKILTVRKDGSGRFTTIQEAVDAANPGDRIMVGPGTFAGANIFGKSNIEIIGTANQTIIDVPCAGHWEIEAFYLENCDTIKISKMTIDANIIDEEYPANLLYCGVWSMNSDNVEVSHLTLYDVQENIVNWGGNNWTIVHNEINGMFSELEYGFQGVGISISAWTERGGTAENNLVSHNTIRDSRDLGARIVEFIGGGGDPHPHASKGILLAGVGGDSEGVSSRNNLFSHNKVAVYNGFYDSQKIGSGVQLMAFEYGIVEGNTISWNDFTGCGNSVYEGGDGTGTIQSNTFLKNHEP